MKKVSKWIQTKSRLLAVGAALGLAFADFDPSTPPPDKQVVQLQVQTDDDKEKTE
ncbi:hypothetical protein QTL97_15030 [Sporosarcina thermotolerans]|uniref:Uncharacterized protein n=1 Tax=Sporosarcina thermotolerans TaxID=633404 RepID=A0AAW9AD25_9BACL|nr:hypothetical protein [Sporosarcina thermotolerans]MDW0118245.1 hypothetical protein [Sporosarcina thermotolerans]WHT48556.1 hypothetical protein QNH10_01590 [Sporosarcina thermotolerans]